MLSLKSLSCASYWRNCLARKQKEQILDHNKFNTFSTIQKIDIPRINTDDRWSSFDAVPTVLFKTKNSDVSPIERANTYQSILANYHGTEDMSFEGQKVLTLLVDNDYFHEAKNLLEMLLDKSVPLDSKVLTRYMQLAQRYKDFDVADEIADYIANVEPIPHASVYETRLIAMLHNQQLNEAITLVEHANGVGVQISHYMYTSLLKHLVDAMRSLEVYSLWSTMLNRGIPLNGESYAAMIRFAGKLGLYDEALSYYELSKCGGMTWPSAHCLFNVLLAVSSRERHETNLQLLFYVMDEAHKYQIAPTQQMYFHIIKTFCRMGDVVSGEFYFFELLRNFYPNPREMFKKSRADPTSRMSLVDIQELFFHLVYAYRLRSEILLSPSVSGDQEPSSSSGPPLSKSQENKKRMEILKVSQPYNEEESIYRQSMDKWGKIRSRILEAKSFFLSPFTVVRAESSANRVSIANDVGPNGEVLGNPDYNPHQAFQRLDPTSSVYTRPPIELSLEECQRRGDQIYESMSKFGIVHNNAIRKEYLKLLAVAGRITKAEAHFKLMLHTKKNTTHFQTAYTIMICMYNEAKEYDKAFAAHKEARSLGLAMRSDVMSFRADEIGLMTEFESDKKPDSKNVNPVVTKFSRKASPVATRGKDLIAFQMTRGVTPAVQKGAQTERRLLGEKMLEILNKNTLSDGGSSSAASRKKETGADQRPRGVIDRFLKSVSIDLTGFQPPVDEQQAEVQSAMTVDEQAPRPKESSTEPASEDRKDDPVVRLGEKEIVSPPAAKANILKSKAPVRRHTTVSYGDQASLSVAQFIANRAVAARVPAAPEAAPSVVFDIVDNQSINVVHSSDELQVPAAKNINSNSNNNINSNSNSNSNIKKLHISSQSRPSPSIAPLILKTVAKARIIKRPTTPLATKSATSAAIPSEVARSDDKRVSSFDQTSSLEKHELPKEIEEKALSSSKPTVNIWDD